MTRMTLEKKQTLPRVRVGMILDQPFPPDARVEREAVSLSKSGYEVHLLCEGREDELPTEELYRGIYIHRVKPAQVSVLLPWFRWPSRLLYRGIIKNYFYQFKNIDTAWHTLINRFIKQYGIQIVHVHDLRLAKTCLNITQYYNLPLVVDLHENYPALIELMKAGKGARHALRKRQYWEKVEEDCLWQANKVITVTKEAKDRLIKKNLSAAHIAVIENTVDMAKFMSVQVDPEISRAFRPYFVLTYVGHINNTHRGLHTVLDALALLKDEIQEIRFIAAGTTQPAYLALLQQQVLAYQLQDVVHFTGSIAETEFVNYIEVSDICLCPHLANEHTNATFPNKVYMYHLFKKPVIVSDAVPLKRYIDSTGGGLSFASGNAEELAKTIRHLYHRSDLRREMALNGHKAVLESYNWQQTSNQLLELYGQLAHQYQNRVVPEAVR
jgi:glycosyltransferase involved in cell wall biosynthesis